MIHLVRVVVFLDGADEKIASGSGLVWNFLRFTPAGSPDRALR
jgi:hypothetical protein